ncbi:unnamed protein product [Plutella xylostella]|uniref:(diamondback moth) hypothetical protein n=1 Tax=Plutella xylostella TaxID=51655 RepID=A0A8S4G4Q8_PLUXY|nr:unnamed protein product [Plutella xylostella]
MRHQSKQLRDPNALFEDSTNTQNAQWTPPGEVAVGGVYLRLFLQNPQWSVRAPKKLLQELLTETLATLPKDCSEGSRGDVCAQALAALLRTRPALADACAQLGELPRLARLLPACPRQALPVLAAVAGTQSCVTALSSTDVMAGVRAAVKSCRDVAGVACEALAAIFSSSANTDRLVSQVSE